MGDHTLIVFLAVAAVLAAVAWVTARFGPGYKSKKLQYDANSPVPATEEEKMQRISAIVAASVMLIGGLVFLAAISLRG